MKKLTTDQINEGQRRAADFLKKRSSGAN
jgi:hypothetical protein